VLPRRSYESATQAAALLNLAIGPTSSTARRDGRQAAMVDLGVAPAARGLADSGGRAWEPSVVADAELRDAQGKTMKDIPQPLLDDIAAGKCLPFIGAGFSRNARLPNDAKMPDWHGLTQVLADAADVSPDQPEPRVASEYERRFGRVQLVEAVRVALQSDAAEPGEAHVAFANLPFDTIYTTNFDLLLEQAYVRIRKPFRSLVGELQLPFHGGALSANIVKMHGDLRHEEHVIITQEDYDLFLDRYPVIATHLSAMLITRTAFFIGYSLADPDFANVQRIVRSRLGKFQRMSYIVQFDQSEQTIEKRLDEHLHVVNVTLRDGQTRGDKLVELFRRIQRELDARAASDIRTARPEMFEEVPSGAIEEVTRAPDASLRLASTSSLCFVLMPFDPRFNDVYRTIVVPAARQVGLEAMRADEIRISGPIMEQVRSAIQQSRICVADLTGNNPNVLYELGIAQTLGKPCILMAQDIRLLPFDIRAYRAIEYDLATMAITDIRSRVEQAITASLGADQLDQARRLIEGGSVVAAVALLSVVLEQAIRRVVAATDPDGARSREFAARHMTMGGMIKTLQAAGRITEDDHAKLLHALNLRNRAVHGFQEPDVETARKMYDTAAEFVARELMPNGPLCE